MEWINCASCCWKKCFKLRASWHRNYILYSEDANQMRNNFCQFLPNLPALCPQHDFSSSSEPQNLTLNIMTSIIYLQSGIRCVQHTNIFFYFFELQKHNLREKKIKIVGLSIMGIKAIVKVVWKLYTSVNDMNVYFFKHNSNEIYDMNRYLCASKPDNFIFQYQIYNILKGTQ